MKSILVVGVALCLAGSAAFAGGGEETEDCANFRCRYGDVPRGDPPLIAEPFAAFYTEAVVRPMTPYQNLKMPIPPEKRREKQNRQREQVVRERRN